MLVQLEITTENLLNAVAQIFRRGGQQSRQTLQSAKCNNFPNQTCTDVVKSKTNGKEKIRHQSVRPDVSR